MQIINESINIYALSMQNTPFTNLLARSIANQPKLLTL
jgi:hypothetical protein